MYAASVHAFPHPFEHVDAIGRVFAFFEAHYKRSIELLACQE